jgi:membrane protein DedA with SNARE-associated domain
VRRFGKYVLITDKALERSERYFGAHGEISVLMGRMLPVVRHLISIPAGLARMSLPAFAIYTGLGACVWCAVLVGIGYLLGRSEGVLRHAEVRHYVTRALLILLPVLAAVTAVYLLRRRRAPSSSGG